MIIYERVWKICDIKGNMYNRYSKSDWSSPSTGPLLVDRINFLTYLNDKQNWIETPQLCIHTKLVLVFSTTWLPDIRVQTATIKTNELTSNKISDHLMQPCTCLSLSNDSTKSPTSGWFTNYTKGYCAKLQNDSQSFNAFTMNRIQWFFNYMMLLRRKVLYLCNYLFEL